MAKYVFDALDKITAILNVIKDEKPTKPRTTNSDYFTRTDQPFHSQLTHLASGSFWSGIRGQFPGILEQDEVP